MTTRVAAVIAMAVLPACVLPVEAGTTAVKQGGQFITRPGTYRLYRRSLSLRVDARSNTLKYMIAWPNGVESGPAAPFSDSASPWFIFAESPGRKSPGAIWIFDGREHLSKIAFDPDGTPELLWKACLYDSNSRPSIVRDAPDAVRDRLPKEFKDKLDAKKGR